MPSGDTAKKAVIMVDVDSWQTQLAFYGYHNQGYHNDVYKNSLPRVADLFERFRVKATFFIVGKHAAISANRGILKRLSRSGHELANHTMTHPQGFSGLSGEEKQREIKDCTSVLEDITAKRIRGFRAPDYDIDEQTIDILAKSGYKYDSSVFPTFMAFPMKFMHFILSGARRAQTMGRPAVSFSPFLPYRPSIDFLYRKGDADIIELPLSVTPFFRLPFYGTSVMALGQKYFDIAFSMIRNQPFVNYTFHAFEMADKDTDSIDSRLFRHPGVKRPLRQKESLCTRVLKKISENFHLMTAEEYIEGAGI